MGKLFFVLTLLCLTSGGFGQTTRPIDAPEAEEHGGAAETDDQAAYHSFDFAGIKINPNNLTAQAIEDLSRNLLPAIKSSVVETGPYPARLARLAAPVFGFHKASKSRTVVFTHSMPTVFTWKETFVAFSTAAMDAFSDDEITALVAHEIGHLYFAEELAQARLKKDDGAAERIIELKCDLVALYTLSKLNIPESNWLAAVEKLIDRRRRLKVESEQPGSPSLESRRRLFNLYASRAGVGDRVKSAAKSIPKPSCVTVRRLPHHLRYRFNRSQ